MKYVSLDNVYLSYDKVLDLLLVQGTDKDGKKKRYQCREVMFHGSEMCMYEQGIWLKHPVRCGLDLQGLNEFGINCKVVHFDSREVPMEKIDVDDYSMGSLDEADSSINRMLIDDYLSEPPFKVGKAYSHDMCMPEDRSKCVKVKWRILAAQRVAFKWHYAVMCENGPYKGKYAVASESMWGRDWAISGTIEGQRFTITKPIRKKKIKPTPRKDEPVEQWDFMQESMADILGIEPTDTEAKE